MEKSVPVIDVRENDGMAQLSLGPAQTKGTSENATPNQCTVVPQSTNQQTTDRSALSAVDSMVVDREFQDMEVGLVATKPPSRPRELSLDLFRGIVMVLMVLDHVGHIYEFGAEIRTSPGEFWYDIPAESQQAQPKDAYDVIYFVIRTLLTNTVAPGFCFLMGMGLQLMIDSRLKLQWSLLRILQYLFVRGFVIAVPMNFLIIVQRNLMNVVRGGPLQLDNCILLALGISLFLASLIVVPLRMASFSRGHHVHAALVAAAGVAFVLIDQAIVYASFASPPEPTVLSATFILPGEAGVWVNDYAVFPVLGATLLGAAFGRVHRCTGTEERTRWRKLWLPFALSLLSFGAFALIRVTGAWGSTNDVKSQLDRGEDYWQAFFLTTKYPFSVAATLYACAFNLLLFSACVWLDLRGSISQERLAFKLPLALGGASLIGYVFHLWLWMFTAAILVAVFAAGGSHVISDGWLGKLGVLLLVFGVQYPVILLCTYAVCKRFGTFKRGTAPDSLWRLL